MKAISCFILCLLAVLVVAPAISQTNVDPGSVPQYFVDNIATSKAYVNSQKDTSRTYTAGGASRLAYNIYAADSISVKTYLDYRIVGDVTWTLKDSVTVTLTAAGYSEWVIRDAITDKVPGLKIQIRFRKAFLASNNGVTSASYSDILTWKP
jgi:hypothetical protein